jgi:hypothetical protein
MVIDGNASDGDMPDDTDDPNELLVMHIYSTSTWCFVYSKHCYIVHNV